MSKDLKKTDDEKFMSMALALAKKAGELDEVPVGAVIVRDGKVVSKAYNLREHKRQATAHAEILAITKACKKTRDFRLTGATIYVTLEPCVMCLGAIMNARIDRLVFCVKSDKAISTQELATKSGLNHNLVIDEFTDNAEAFSLIKDYFAEKRKIKK